MNIVGKVVTLRAMTLDDMQMICDMFNDPNMESKVIGWAFPLSLDQQIAWYKNHMNDRNDFRFAIETSEDGAVGIATLTGIDWKNRTATHGIKLANQENRSRGIGTDTVLAIMRYAFEELGLHRLESSIFPENVASRKLYSKCGWKDEGVKRSCIFKGGQWKDLILIGVLDADYREVAQKLEYWSE